MMNIISNDCTSAYLYKELLHAEYPHMFNPTWMSAENFIKLIENYDKINFKNITVKKLSEIIDKENGHDIEKYLAGSRINNDVCFVTIDNKVDVIYDRYIEDGDLEMPETDVMNGEEYMFVPELKSYVKERYFARLVRMLQNNTEPVFVFNEQTCTTEEELDAFIFAETPYKKVLFTSKPEYLIYEDEGMYVEVCYPDLVGNDSYINCAEFVTDILA